LLRSCRTPIALPFDQSVEEQLGFTGQHRITAKRCDGSTSPCDCAIEVSGSRGITSLLFKASRRCRIVSESASIDLATVHVTPPLSAAPVAAVCSANQRRISSMEYLTEPPTIA